MLSGHVDGVVAKDWRCASDVFFLRSMATTPRQRQRRLFCFSSSTLFFLLFLLVVFLDPRAKTAYPEPYGYCLLKLANAKNRAIENLLAGHGNSAKRKVIPMLINIQAIRLVIWK